MLGEPYLIADVSVDLTGGYGHVFASDVYSFSSLGRKKRSEVALAIDRQGINIYDVRFSRLVTSYVISPQAKVTCPPCTFRYKSSTDLSAQRYTYCCVKLSKPRILGFSEHSTPTSSLTAISTFGIDIENCNPVLYLDVIQKASAVGHPEQDHTIFAVHEDGSITYFSAKLDRAWSRSRQRVAPRSDLAKSLNFEYVIALSRRQAMKTLLRSREDITSALKSNEQGLNSILLFAVTSNPIPRNSHASHFHASLFELAEDQGAASDATSFQFDLSELISQAIPLPPQCADGPSHFTLHVSSAALHQTSRTGTGIFDFTNFAPRLSQIVSSSVSNFESSIRLSPNLLAVAVMDKVEVLDVPFGALRASKKLGEVEGSSHNSHPSRDREVALHHDSVRLLSHSPQQNVVIAFYQHKVLAIPTLVQDLSSVPRKRARDGLLIGSLGRGAATQYPEKQVIQRSQLEGLGAMRPSGSNDVSWETHKRSLDRLLYERNLEAFEESFFRKLSSSEYSSIPSHKVDYILSKMFHTRHYASQPNEKNEEAGMLLQVVTWPKKLGQSMLSQDLISQDRIESSLKQTGALPPDSSLAPGALLKALAEWDMSLSILKDAISGSLNLSTFELATTLALLVPMIENEGKVNQMKLLTNGTAQPSDDAGHDLQPFDDNRRFEQDGSAYNRVEKAKEILYLVLKKTYSLAPQSSAPVLRQVLGTRQLRSLMDILRLELASEGWLSFYDQYDRTKEPCVVDDHITYLSHLLIVILDALGPAGWMIGSAPSDELAEAANTISHIKAEISATLEGIEEATYLQHVLGEVLLCGKDSLLPRGQFQQKYSLDSGMKKEAIRPSNAAFHGLSNSQLPLGLKLRPQIPLTKVGAGGEIIKRSKRDLGRLKSQTVGKYSFEKIKL